MTTSTTDRQHGRALKSLLEKGIAATATGALFVLAPQFLATHLTPQVLAPPLATGLQISGFILILLGVGTLALRHSVRIRVKKLSNLRRGSGVAERNQRMNYVTRGGPSSPAQAFPISPDSTQAPNGQRSASLV